MPNCFYCAHLDYDLDKDKDDDDNELYCRAQGYEPSKLKNHSLAPGHVSHEHAHTDCPCDEYEEIFYW